MARLRLQGSRPIPSLIDFVKLLFSLIIVCSSAFWRQLSDHRPARTHTAEKATSPTSATKTGPRNCPKPVITPGSMERRRRGSRST